jgi:hypothetical protein
MLFARDHLAILTSLDVDMSLEQERAFWASTGVLDRLLKEAEQCTGWEYTEWDEDLPPDSIEPPACQLVPSAFPASLSAVCFLLLGIPSSSLWDLGKRKGKERKGNNTTLCRQEDLSGRRWRWGCVRDTTRTSLPRHTHAPREELSRDSPCSTVLPKLSCDAWRLILAVDSNS